MAPNRYPKRSQLHAFMAAEQGMMLGSMRPAGMDRSRARPWSQVPGRAVDFLICGSRPTNGIIDDYNMYRIGWFLGIFFFRKVTLGSYALTSVIKI